MKTTAENTFYKCNIQGDELFAVRAGIPVADAINEASALLDTVIGLLVDEDSHVCYGATVLVRLAKAAIDSVDLS